MRDPLSELRYFELNPPPPWAEVTSTLLRAVQLLQEVVLWQDSRIDHLERRIDDLHEEL